MQIYPIEKKSKMYDRIGKQYLFIICDLKDKIF